MKKLGRKLFAFNCALIMSAFFILLVPLIILYLLVNSFIDEDEILDFAIDLVGYKHE